MVRTQIQLTADQARRLRDTARRSGVSVAEIIRRSVDSYLDRETTVPTAAAGRLSALDVIGMFCSGPSDVAERHDDYLDQAYLPPTRPPSHL